MRFVPLILAALAAAAGADVMDLSGWVSLAMENSPDLARADASVMSASSGVSSSRSSLLPSLSLSASAGHSWYSSPFGGDVDEETYGCGVTLSQEILASGGAGWIELSASRLQLEAARKERESAVLELQLSVARAFYGVVEAAGLVESALASLARSESQLERVEALYALGAATRLELVQSQVSESRDRLAVAQRRQALDTAYTELYRVAGVSGTPLGELLVDTAAVLRPLDAAEAEAIAVSVEENPTLSAARLSAEGAAATLSARRRSGIPSLSASASWNWSDTRFEPGDIPDEDSWNVRLNLTWQIFDGWLRESRIQAARAGELSAQAQARSTENSLAGAAANARETLLNAITNYELALLSLDYAGKQMELSQMSYDLGSLGLIDLLDAQAALTEAEAAVVSARVDCLVAEAELWVLMGRSPRLGE